MYNEEQMQIIISAYQKNGIVTRNDYAGVDSRPYAKEVHTELQRRGYIEAAIIEAHLENYIDYSSVIFNPNIYDYKEAEAYMIQNVLEYLV